ncbi:MAG: ArsR/SmtB family transcription factor [Candidatus Thorarchaeota archaeon]
MTFPELLTDPVRARIYIEVLLKKELTAQELMGVVDINRSTMSHHLSRFVKEGVFNVRIETIGRSVKYYSINPDYADEIIIEGDCTPNVKKQIAFLETASAHLQVISNLMRERATKLRESLQLPRKKKGIPVVFTVCFISDEEAKVWAEEYAIFDEKVRRRWDKIRQDTPDPSFDHVAFSGLTPTRTN